MSGFFAAGVGILAKRCNMNRSHFSYAVAAAQAKKGAKRFYQVRTTRYMRPLERGVLGILLCGLAACTHLDERQTTTVQQAPGASEQTLPPLSDSAQKRAEALARYSEGTVLEGRKDYDGALSNYMIAAQLDPENEPLQMRIAVLLLQQKRTTEAVQVLEKLAANPKASDRPLLLLAMVYEGSGDFANAERVYKKLLELYPDRQEAYANLARLYLKQEQLDTAIRTLEQAAETLKQPDELLMLLAAAYIMRAEKQPGTPDNYYNAIRVLEKLAEKYPNDLRMQAQFQIQIAELYLNAGDYQKALLAMANVERASGDAAEIKNRLAGLLTKNRDPATVLKKLAEIAEREAHPERVYYYMGLVSEAAQQSDRAVDYYRRAVEGEQPQLGAIISLAVLQATNLATSLETVQRGLDKFPEHPMLLNVMANIFFLQTNFQAAVEYFQRAARQSESNATPIRNANFYFNYAVALLNLGDTEAASEQLRQAAKLNSAVLENYLQLAFRQTDPVLQKRFIEVLEKVGERISGEPDVYLYLGVLNSYLGFHAEALRAFERVEKIVQETAPQESPLTAQFYFWYGSAAERSGHIERAEKLFMKCIELDPNHAEALNYLAYMWAERGKELDQALAFVKRALELQPSSGAFVDTLGWIYYMQGNYTQALVEINRAAELIPEDPTILEHLGDVFEKLGDQEQALPHWKRSFVLNPENEKLAEKLTRLGVDLEPLREQSRQLKQRSNDAPPPQEPSTTNATAPSLLSPVPLPSDIGPDDETQEFEEADPDIEGSDDTDEMEKGD